eukprot:CAMPEP_0175609076 /NCGR_PEP_ID=MMETSP0096-20121207/62077_1 /TAXON_ID=311494 /ORGANISM="Alexandrium monilatum, Strain CCMP3105" /LENGTH=48 /DNA_ID= /DNA_START= /DNA_END= /DNA_ORIENTATION=
MTGSQLVSLQHRTAVKSPPQQSGFPGTPKRGWQHNHGWKPPFQQLSTT